MAIEITEVDLAEMHRTALLNRAKSPNVRALYEAMFSLKPGEAKAVIAESGGDLSQIRNLVTQCATRANMELQIVVDRIAGRVLFTNKPNQPHSTDTVKGPLSATRTPEDQAALVERRMKIREAALELGMQRPQISAQEVVDHLRDMGNELELPRPTTAVSAVVRNMSEFDRIGQSRFSYRG